MKTLHSRTGMHLRPAGRASKALAIVVVLAPLAAGLPAGADTVQALATVDSSTPPAGMTWTAECYFNMPPPATGQGTDWWPASLQLVFGGGSIPGWKRPCGKNLPLGQTIDLNIGDTTGTGALEFVKATPSGPYYEAIDWPFPLRFVFWGLKGAVAGNVSGPGGVGMQGQPLAVYTVHHGECSPGSGTYCDSFGFATRTVADASGFFSIDGENHWALDVDQPPYSPVPCGGPFGGGGGGCPQGQRRYRIVAGRLGQADDPPPTQPPYLDVTVKSSELKWVDLRVGNPEATENPDEDTKDLAEKLAEAGGPCGGAAPPAAGESCPVEAPDPPESRGGPVNLRTGSVFLEQVDAVMPHVRGRAIFSRLYNSRRANAGKEGIFGRGWDSSYEKRLTVIVPGKLLRLNPGTGGVRYFSGPGATGVFRSNALGWDRSSLESAADSFTRKLKQGGTETYDAAGRLVKQEDRVGNATILTYNADDRLASIETPGGRTLALSYDGPRVSTLSGPGGLIASYSYDASGLLQQVTYPDGSGYTFTYDSSAQLTAVQDLEGTILERHDYVGGRAVTSERSNGIEKLTIAYSDDAVTVTDALGRATEYHMVEAADRRRVNSVIDGCSSCSGGKEQRRWGYDAQGRIVTYINGAGETWHYAYDEAGDLSSVEDPLQRATSYTYDEFGRALTRSDPDGGGVSWTYGAAGPLTATDRASRTVSLGYDSRGLLTSVTNSRGKSVGLEFDSVGDLRSVTDPLGHRVSFVYDPMGRLTSVTDALQKTTSFAYDGRGRLTRVTAHDGTHTDVAYDRGGRPTELTDALGRALGYAYDAYGRLVATQDPAGNVTGFTYDAMSQLLALTDAKGNRTSYGYDSLGRVSTTTYPDGGVESYLYDSAGRVVTSTDRRDVVTQYSYDGGGRLISRTNPDGMSTYGYDDLDRLVLAANATDSLTWSYAPDGRVATETSGRHGTTVAYGYDDLGRPSSLSLDGSVVAGYSYDDASRLTAITQGTLAFGFVHDNVGRRTSLSFPNGVVTSYGYDDLSRLQSIDVARLGSPIAQFTYAHDAVGNRTSKTGLGFAEAYAYDQLSRLIGAERSGAGAGSSAFGYEGVGNRTVSQHGPTVETSTFNVANRLLSRSGGGSTKWRVQLDEAGVVTVSGGGATDKPTRALPGNVYEAELDLPAGASTVTVKATDASGNTRTQEYEMVVDGSPATFAYDANGNLTSKTEGGSTWTYDWTADNGLKRVTRDGVEVARFAYDPLGRRVEKVAGGITYSYVYSGMDIVRESRSDGTRYTYLHGPGIDEPLARIDQTGAVAYYHADGLGSIVKMTDQSGTVIQTRQYDAWGNLELGASDSGYAFTGREWDPETGLYYYRARYYDPRLGRFISEDPIGFLGGVNFYGYVGNSPAQFLDPMGEDWIDATLYYGAQFSAGFGDTLSFGVTGYIRKLWDVDDLVDRCSGWYKGGMYSEIGLEVGLTGVSFALRGAAKGVTQTAVRRGLTAHGTQGVSAMHHINPLKSSLFPTAVLPEAVRHGSLNTKLLTTAEHTAAHADLARAEKYLVSGFNPAATTARATVAATTQCGCR
jgi:RHS repeat-associated protein